MRVAHVYYKKGNQLLMLHKHSRDWWVAPGGKAITGEDILDTARREFWEETGLTAKHMQLCCVSTIEVLDENEHKDMLLFSFFVTEASGEQLDENHEGVLAWQDIDTIHDLRMPQGDHFIIEHILGNNNFVEIARFQYDADYNLKEYKLEGAE
ncbi:NUDIX hydrolase [Culicoidibacter larvae]|uniref:NUDIX domain-containing protein n=1 Tax=Culicoidibacter larvae TaxID=2579976 RepID=A0A5R8QIN0_9FIRM|nr:NUDIX domain-containing protein [Culicoidibacter larvae]TLG77303.1 NUDIX domain-containing protein [Culicoidibacter larvae]